MWLTVPQGWAKNLGFLASLMFAEAAAGLRMMLVLGLLGLVTSLPWA